MRKMLTPILLIQLLVTSYPGLAAEGSLFECRQIDDIKERVLCYDKIVDALSSPPLSTTAIDNPEQAPKPDAHALFGKDAAETSRIVEKTLAIEKLEQIQARITGLKRSVDKKFTITLDNGQIWRQIDNQRIPLRNEDKIIIREATLGSYLMEKQSGSGSIRVKRLD